MNKSNIIQINESETSQKTADNSITIHLSDHQYKIMKKAVKRYNLTLEQACLYGFFNFESCLDPNSGDGWSAVESLLEAQNPEQAFENRYIPTLPDYLKEEESEEAA